MPKFWKSQQGKLLIAKRYKAAFLIAFVVILGYPAYALPIKDVQSTTSCELYDCVTWVDLTTIGLTTNQINNVKSMNLTKFLPRAEQYTGLQDMAYRINGNILYITGHIKDNVYWTMDLGTYVTLDPWWNYTVNYYRIPSNASAVLAIPFDEGNGAGISLAKDRSGLGNNATLVTDHKPTWADGKYDSGLLYKPSATQYCTVANNSFLNLAGSMTIMAWIKANNTGSLQYIYGNHLAGSPFTGWSFAIGQSAGSSKISFWSSVAGAWVNSNTQVTDQLWHHVALAFNATAQTYQFYRDGMADGNGASGSSLALYGATKTIGTAAALSGYFNGTIDELKIFNKTLTVAEVQEEMNTPINFSYQVNVSYTTSLFLNGIEGNISILPTQSLNVTAVTNLTGLNVSIYNDSTFLNSSLTSAQWNGTLTLGTHNITATYSNSSTSSFLTYWVDVSIPPNYAIDTHICFKTKPVCIDTLTNKIYINGVQQ